MLNMPHPIQYQGSKRIIAPVILRYFPKPIDVLYEPFAGSAAISIASAVRGMANSYVINDLNKPLAELLKIIVEKPEETASAYEKIWFGQDSTNSIEHYYRIREEFNKTQDPKLFLYLLARCVKGSVRYNADGLFNQSPDKRRLGTRPDTMKQNIFGVSHLLKGKASFSCLDYKNVLVDARPQDLIYMDPPYQGVCGDRDSRYLSGVCFSEFAEALEKLNSRDIAYIVSYDGRRGDKKFGELLPDELNLCRVEIEAGKSTQATLLGKEEVTYESLYLSRSLLKKLALVPTDFKKTKIRQFTLFEPSSAYTRIT